MPLVQNFRTYWHKLYKENMLRRTKRLEKNIESIRTKVAYKQKDQPTEVDKRDKGKQKQTSVRETSRAIE